jgi:hypothetical protein
MKDARLKGERKSDECQESGGATVARKTALFKQGLGEKRMRWRLIW